MHDPDADWNIFVHFGMLSVKFGSEKAWNSNKNWMVASIHEYEYFSIKNVGYVSTHQHQRNLTWEFKLFVLNFERTYDLNYELLYAVLIRFWIILLSVWFMACNYENISKRIGVCFDPNLCSNKPTNGEEKL